VPFSGSLTLATVIAGIGALVILVLAVVQEGKLGGHGTSVKHGFYAAVSLVLLAIAVAASVFVVYLGLSTWVFTKAPYNNGAVMYDRAAPPLPLTVVTKEGLSTLAPTYVRQCTTTCDFTTDEVTAIHSWATQYKSWTLESSNTVDPYATAKRRDLVNALSFLLVSAPLFFVFFRFIRRPRESGPTVVRSVYFYYVAFAGLVLAVVSAAILLNTGLKSIAGVTEDSPKPIPQPLNTDDPNTQFVQSIVRCAPLCGFSAEEVALAQRWPMDYQKQFSYHLSGTSKTQGDLAQNIPLLLVGIPLFWYHFAVVRREGTAKPKRRGRSK
jgi:hypothetical protein